MVFWRDDDCNQWIFTAIFSHKAVSLGFRTTRLSETAICIAKNESTLGLLQPRLELVQPLMVGHARVVVRVAPLTGGRLGCNPKTGGDGLWDADVASAVVGDGAAVGRLVRCERRSRFHTAEAMFRSR